MRVRLSLWERWKAAMRSFLHCVEEGYRRSTTPYIDQRIIYDDREDESDGDDIPEPDPGSTSTQLSDIGINPQPVETRSYDDDGLMNE
jgi:hypothetical protein